MGKFADFIFGIHHRPGQVNADDEGLSRLPRDFHTYKDSCTEKLFPESLHASISAVQTLSHGDLMWLTTLTDDDALSSERRLSYWTRPWVLKANRKPTEEETYKESALVCKLLNEWRKLHVHYTGTAITKGKTPVPACWPKISLVGRGWYLDGWPSRLETLCCTPWEDRLA